MKKDYFIGLYAIVRDTFMTADDINRFLEIAQKLNDLSQDNSASLDSKVKVLYDYLISIGKVDSINMLTNFNIYETIEQKLKVEFDTTEMQKTLYKFGNDIYNEELISVYVTNGLYLLDNEMNIKYEDRDKAPDDYTDALEILQTYPNFATIQNFLNIVVKCNMIYLYRRRVKEDDYAELEIPTMLFNQLNHDTIIGDMIVHIFKEIYDDVLTDEQLITYVNKLLEKNKKPTLELDPQQNENNVQILKAQKLMNTNDSLKINFIKSKQNYLPKVKNSYFQWFLVNPDIYNNLALLTMDDYRNIIEKIGVILKEEYDKINSNVQGVIKASEIFRINIDYVNLNIMEFIMRVTKKADFVKTCKEGAKFGESMRVMANTVLAHEINTVKNDNEPGRIVMFKEGISGNTIFDWFTSIVDESSNTINYKAFIDTRVFQENNTKDTFGQLNVYNTAFTISKILTYNYLEHITESYGVLSMYTLIKTKMI